MLRHGIRFSHYRLPPTGSAVPSASVFKPNRINDAGYSTPKKTKQLKANPNRKRGLGCSCRKRLSLKSCAAWKVDTALRQRIGGPLSVFASSMPLIDMDRYTYIYICICIYIYTQNTGSKSYWHVPPISNTLNSAPVRVHCFESTSIWKQNLTYF